MSEQQQPPKSRWRVSGANESTGETVTLYVEARSRDSAERVVAKSGILVSNVEPDPLPYAQPADDNVTTIHVDSVRAGAAFAFGFHAFLGGLAAYLIIATILAVILLALGRLTLPGR